MLNAIVAVRRIAVKEYRARHSPRELAARLAQVPPPRDFALVLRRKEGESMRLIAEIKVASPSAGILCRNLIPSQYVRAYENGGASALSVVVEPRFFLGSGDLLREVKNLTSLPVLAKDFIIDPVQIYLARTQGADAVLLLASLLSLETLREFVALANSLGMASLVEVHDEEELTRALESGTNLIGINNRDLNTFQIDLSTTERLKKLIPAEYLSVSESGIKTKLDWERIAQTGVDGVLIGEAFMRAQNPTAQMLTFLGLRRHPESSEGGREDGINGNVAR
ncbi:MAG: indole-3-glycerol phosphate synthase TrpC [Bacillota bacterium]|nr:indole-3-glycerol phosphate synthase TrpC [Bacillota bacterium]